MDFSSTFVKGFVTQAKPGIAYEQKVRGKKLQLDNPKVLSKREKKSKYNINRIRGTDINVPSNETLLKLHALWCTYTLSLDQPAQFIKMDFHGAMLTVIRSGVPSNVGLSGICLRESQHMFYIVVEGVLKAIPKQGHVFTLTIKDKLVTLFGNHMRHKPADRINKKIKSKAFELF
jgi:ribonuclease P protein subunit POP4